MSAIYEVETVGKTVRLVKASSKSVAVNHIVKDTVKARPLTALEAIEHIQDGVIVEDAGKASITQNRESAGDITEVFIPPEAVEPEDIIE